MIRQRQATAPEPAVKSTNPKHTRAVVRTFPRIMVLSTPLTSFCTNSGTSPAATHFERARIALRAISWGTAAFALFATSAGPRDGRRSQAEADQAVAQALAPAKPPALDGSNRAAHSPRCFLAGVSLEVTEDDWNAVAVRKPVDLLVEHSFELGRGPVLSRKQMRRHPGNSQLVSPAPGRIRPGTRRRAKSHLMQPRAQGISNPEGAGLLDQDQESRLKSILGVMRVRELGTADAQHHRTMSLHQGLERQFGDLTPAVREPLEQLPVSELADGSDVEERVQLPLDGSFLRGLHRFSPVRFAASVAVSNVTTRQAGCNFLDGGGFIYLPSFSFGHIGAEIRQVPTSQRSQLRDNGLLLPSFAHIRQVASTSDV